jgi:hypothetical protein
VKILNAGVTFLNALPSRSEKEVLMNTLRKKLTVIGLTGVVGLGSLAIPAVPAIAVPVAPSQNIVKQAAPSQTEQVRHRRWVGPAIALGVIGAVAAHQYHRRNYYYDPYYRPYRPAYYGYYGPRQYYGPGPYYYGW